MVVILAQGANIGIGAAIGELEPHGGGAPSAIVGDAGQREAELFDLDGPDGSDGPVTPILRAKRSGPGRPPGSPNKKTEDLRRFILARFKHPVVALMEIGAIGTAELARELGLKAGEALALQIRALAEAAPYVDSKMPMRLALGDSDRLPSWSISFGNGSATISDGRGHQVDLVSLAARAKNAMDQRLIEGEAIRSHDAGSHSGEQVIAAAAETTG